MNSRPIKFFVIYIAVLFIGCSWMTSCGPKPSTSGPRFASVPSESTDYSGYIIISNNATKNVVLLDPNGNYVKDLLILDRAGTEVPWGLGMYDDKNLLITVDGVDRVMLANLDTGNADVYITNPALTGTIRGVTRLNSGHILVGETNNVERFTGDAIPSRITSGWPLALANTARSLATLPGSSNFIHCGGGSADFVRSYTDNITSAPTLATATAIAPAPSLGAAHDGMACALGPQGQVAVAWNGATDTIRVYPNINMTAVSWSYTGGSLLPNPVAVAFRPNGNVLALDGTTNLMVEIDTGGNLVQTFQSSFINTPNQILVVP